MDRARENEIPMKYWNGLQKGNTYEEDGHIYTPDMVLGPDRKGLKLTYCTGYQTDPPYREVCSRIRFVHM